MAVGLEYGVPWQSLKQRISWSACPNAVSTCVNLSKSGINIDVYCPVCGEGYETTTNIFVECELAIIYKRMSPFRLSTCDRSEKDFGAWCPSFTGCLMAWVICNSVVGFVEHKK